MVKAIFNLYLLHNTSQNLLLIAMGNTDFVTYYPVINFSTCIEIYSTKTASAKPILLFLHIIH